MEIHLVFCLRLLEATALGALVGLERELAGKPSGLRTNTLICAGAGLMTQVSLALPALAGGGDPGRIAAQIVAGIGFLGAGAIVKSRHTVHGLTSAATIWIVAGLGMAVGAGVGQDAILAAALILATILFLGKIERSLLGHEVITMTVSCGVDVPDPKDLLARVPLRRRLLGSEWRRRDESTGVLTLSWRGVASDARLLATVIATVPGASMDGWAVEE